MPGMRRLHHPPFGRGLCLSAGGGDRRRSYGDQPGGAGAGPAGFPLRGRSCSIVSWGCPSRSLPCSPCCWRGMGGGSQTGYGPGHGGLRVAILGAAGGKTGLLAGLPTSGSQSVRRTGGGFFPGQGAGDRTLSYKRRCLEGKPNGIKGCARIKIIVYFKIVFYMRYGLVLENSICYNVTIEKTNIVLDDDYCGRVSVPTEWNTEGIKRPHLPSGTLISPKGRGTAGGSGLLKEDHDSRNMAPKGQPRLTGRKLSGFQQGAGHYMIRIPCPVFAKERLSCFW